MQKSVACEDKTCTAFSETPEAVECAVHRVHTVARVQAPCWLHYSVGHSSGASQPLTYSDLNHRMSCWGAEGGGMPSGLRAKQLTAVCNMPTGEKGA